MNRIHTIDPLIVDRSSGVPRNDNRISRRATDTSNLDPILSLDFEAKRLDMF